MTPGKDDYDLKGLMEAAAVVEQDAPEPRSRFYRLSEEEILAQPDPVWIVDDLLKDGDFVVIYGAAGDGKTFVAMDLAYQLMRGEGLFAGKYEVNERRTVYYMAGEGQSGFKYRVAGAIHKHGRMGDRFGWCPDVPEVTSPAAVDQYLKHLADLMESGFHPQVVIVDTMRNALAEANENDSQSAAAVVAAVRRIRELLGPETVVIMLHHANKSNGLSGSTAWQAMADLILKVDYDKVTGVRTMSTDKIKYGVEQSDRAFVLEQVPDEPRLAFVAWREGMTGNPRSDQAKERSAVIVQTLREYHRGYENKAQVGEIFKTTGALCSKPQLWKDLMKLANLATSGVTRCTEKGAAGGYFYWDPRHDEGLE